jgi:hypothetical protein
LEKFITIFRTQKLILIAILQTLEKFSSDALKTDIKGQDREKQETVEE